MRTAARALLLPVVVAFLGGAGLWLWLVRHRPHDEHAAPDPTPGQASPEARVPAAAAEPGRPLLPLPPPAAPSAAADDVEVGAAKVEEAERRSARGPRIEGSLQLPSGFVAEWFRITYRCRPKEPLLPIHLSSSGQFRLFTVEPGTIDVFVHLLGDPSPLRVVPGVGVAVDGTNLDPRLQGIELPELRLAHLGVFDAEGSPVSKPVSVLVLPPRGDAGRRYTFGAGEEIAVPARERPQRVQVWAEGHAAVDLEVHDHERVELPAPAIVTLEVTIEVDVPRFGALKVGVEPVDSVRSGPPSTRAGAPAKDGNRSDVAVSQPLWIEPTRTRGGGEFRCALPGRYRVMWHLRRPPESDLSGEFQALDVELGRSYAVSAVLTAADVAAAANGSIGR